MLKQLINLLFLYQVHFDINKVLGRRTALVLLHGFWAPKLVLSNIRKVCKGLVKTQLVAVQDGALHSARVNTWVVDVVVYFY